MSSEQPNKIALPTRSMSPLEKLHETAKNLAKDAQEELASLIAQLAQQKVDEYVDVEFEESHADAS